MTWKEHQQEQKAREEREAVEHEQRMQAHREKISELKARQAELQQTVDRLLARAGKEKILYLPKGRVRHCEHSSLEFVVNDRTAALLNLFAVDRFDQGGTPHLDLMHDRKSRIFEISKFEFKEDAGVFAYGRYTALGRKLRDSGRISGVSISTPILTLDDKPVCGSLQCEISREDAAGIEKVSMTPENLCNFGAVLIDGQKSAIQPVPQPRDQNQTQTN